MFSCIGHDDLEKVSEDAHQCIKCKFFHLSKLEFPKLFNLVSSLNGSNGEWTNADDLWFSIMCIYYLVKYVSILFIVLILILNYRLFLMSSSFLYKRTLQIIEVRELLHIKGHMVYNAVVDMICGILFLVVAFFVFIFSYVFWWTVYILCIYFIAKVVLITTLLSVGLGLILGSLLFNAIGLWWVYFVVIQSVKLFRKPTQLNGNNGEWTNSDDTRPPSTQGRIRGQADRNVEPVVYQPRLPGVQRIDTRVCAHYLVGRCTRLNCRFQHPIPEESLQILTVEGEDAPLIKPIIPVLWDFGGVVWDGVTFRRKSMDSFVIKPESQVFAKQQKDGTWFLQSESESGVLTPIQFLHDKYPAFEYGIVNYKGYDKVLISDRVLIYLRTENKICSKELRNQNALAGMIIHKYPLMPEQLIKHTIEFYLYRCSLLKNDTDISVRECERINATAMTHLSFSEWQYKQAVNDFKKDPYDYNDLFEKGPGKGFVLEVDPESHKILDGPRFTSQEIKKVKEFVVFCSFLPKGSFEYINPSNLSMCNGLARYLARREGEDELNSNQLRILSGYDNSKINHVASLCGAKIEHLEKGKFLVKGPHRIPFKQDRRYTPFTRALIDRFSYGYLFVSVMLYFVSIFIGALWNSVGYIFDGTYKFVPHVDRVIASVAPPHDKKDLYTKYITDNLKFFKIVNSDTHCESNVKWEVAKQNSYARLYGSFGEGALVDRLAPAICKAFFKSSFSFEEILPLCVEHQTPTFGFVYYETDISKCDMSNRFAIMVVCHAIIEKVAGITIADYLIRQLHCPTKLVNPDNDSEFTFFKPYFFFLYSGSVLTTLLNNIASYYIFVSIYLECKVSAMDVCFHDCQEVSQRNQFWKTFLGSEKSYGAFFSDDGLLKIDCHVTKESVEQAAYSVGYKLTVDERNSPARMTFLKSCSDGEESLLTIGPILRTLGHVDKWEGVTFGLSQADFLGKNKTELFEIHGKQRITGLKNEPGNRILNALRRRFGVVVPSSYISDEVLYRRYDFSQSDLDILETHIEQLHLGSCITGFAVQKIFHVDYATPDPRGSSPLNP